MMLKKRGDCMEFFGPVWDIVCRIFNVVSDALQPFEVNITDLCKQKDNIIAIRVVDEDDTTQPRGKQYWKETTDRCWYYPTSGIWQSLWLEYRGKGYLKKWLVTPNIDNNSILTEYEVTGTATHLVTKISYKGQLRKR